MTEKAVFCDSKEVYMDEVHSQILARVLGN